MENEYWVTMLSTCGEIGIGIAGFSGVVVALSLAKEIQWDRHRIASLNVLLSASGAAIFFSILPFFLLGFELELSEVWMWSSVLYCAVTILIAILRMRREQLEVRVILRSPIFAGTLAMLGIAIGNVLVWRDSWAHLTLVYWQICVAFLVFTRILWGLGETENGNSETPTSS